MSNAVPPQTKGRGVYKAREFETYLKWRALPASYRDMPRQSLEKMGFDESMQDLLEIKSQKAFGQRYQIDESTLTQWNAKIDRDGLLDDTRTWMRSMTPLVLGSLLKKIIKNPHSSDIRLWLEYGEGL
jgi:hypothetical protein